MATIARSAGNDWMLHPGLSFKHFEESIIKAPFAFTNSTHIVPEKITESFIDSNGVRCYRVKWVDSWLNEQHLNSTFPHLVTDYWLNKPIENVEYQNYLNNRSIPILSLPVNPTSVANKTQHIAKTSNDSTPTATSLVFQSISGPPNVSLMSPIITQAGDNYLNEKNPLNSESQSSSKEPPAVEDFSVVGESLKLPEKLEMGEGRLKEAESNKRNSKESDEKAEQSTSKDQEIVFFLEKSNFTETVKNVAKPTTVPSVVYGSYDHLQRYIGSHQSIQLSSLEQLNHFQQIQMQQEVSEKKLFAQKKFSKKAKSEAPKEKCPVACDICGKMISSRKNLRVHKTVKHYKNGSFSCDICNRKFALNRDLKRHMPLHTNERNYVCAHCGLQCKQPGHLTKHMRTHTEVMNWRCDCCFKNFKVQADLKEHCFSEHSNIKDANLTCSVCKERLKLPNSVYLHSLRHSGVREFHCPVCKASFKLKQHLQVHMRTHERHKKVACHVCAKEFRQQHVLDNHVAKHTERTAEEWREKKRLQREEKIQRRASTVNQTNKRNATKRKQVNPGKILVDGDAESARKKFRAKASYKCEQCGDCFRTKPSLSSHIELHEEEITGEKKENDTIVCVELLDKNTPKPSDAVTLPSSQECHSLNQVDGTEDIACNETEVLENDADDGKASFHETDVLENDADVGKTSSYETEVLENDADSKASSNEKTNLLESIHSFVT